MPDLSKATLINSTILNGAGSESTDTDVAGLEQSDTGPTGREPNIQTATNKTDLTARTDVLS